MPHRLYGVRPAAEPGTAAWWRAAALAVMEEARDAGRLPILCGGTGLYFAALIDGISEIPAPSMAARAEARALLADTGRPACMRASPRSIPRRRHGFARAIASASHGPWRSGSGPGGAWPAWHATGAAAHAWGFRAILLDPPRAALRAAIAPRFEAMLAAGALDEVRALLALRPRPEPAGDARAWRARAIRPSAGEII